MKIDWKSKLTSRKFWAAIVGFVTPLMLALGMSQSDTTQATAIIMAGGTLIAYIIGEGLVDSAREGKDDPIMYVEKEEEEDEKND